MSRIDGHMTVRYRHPKQSSFCDCLWLNYTRWGRSSWCDMLPVFTLFSNTKHSFFHYLCMLMTLYHHIRYSHPSPNFQTPNHIYTKPAAFLPLRHPQVAQPSVFILQLSVPQSLRHSASETGHPGSCGGAENNKQSLSWIIAENNFEIQIALSTIWDNMKNVWNL